MKLTLAMIAIMLGCSAAMAADKPMHAAKPSPCPKGEVATHLDTWNGKLVCARPRPIMAAPVQAANGGPVTAPVLMKPN